MSTSLPILRCIFLFCLHIQTTFVFCFDLFFSQFLFLLFFLLFQHIDFFFFFIFSTICFLFICFFFYFGRDCLRSNIWRFIKFSCTIFRYSFLASSKSLIYSLSFLSLLSFSSLNLLKSFSKSVNNSFIS